MLRAMADLDLSVKITRDELALADLEINDFVDYYVTNEFLGGSVSWNRVRATGPFTDGGPEISATRDPVNEPLGVEILGSSTADALAKLAVLTTALHQRNFDMKVRVSGTLVLHYSCNRADSQLIWTGPRAIAGQLQAKFTVPRQPRPLVGAI